MVPIQWFHPWHLNLDLLRFGGPTHLARQAEKNTHKTKGLGTFFSHRIFGLRIYIYFFHIYIYTYNYIYIYIYTYIDVVWTHTWPFFWGWKRDLQLRNHKVTLKKLVYIITKRTWMINKIPTKKQSLVKTPTFLMVFGLLGYIFVFTKSMIFPPKFVLDPIDPPLAWHWHERPGVLPWCWWQSLWGAGGVADSLCQWPQFTTWWFQTFLIFTPTCGRFPFWFIFFRWVETTNQFTYFSFNFWWMTYILIYPGIFNMEHNDRGLEDDFTFLKGVMFRFHVNLPGCI